MMVSESTLVVLLEMLWDSASSSLGLYNRRRGEMGKLNMSFRHEIEDVLGIESEEKGALRLALVEFD